jgi:Uma2 family endonuclease
MTYQQLVASTRESQIHSWTVEEYHQLIKARLLGVNEPTELIAGQVIRQNPLPTAGHSSGIKLLQAMLQRRLGDRALVRSQRPVILGKYSEPKPDLAIVTGDASKYRYHNPTPVDIALILEVNDGDLAIDCEVKASEYAQAGLQDYWVLDLKRWQLNVFRDIAVGQYQTRWVLNQGDQVSPLAFSDVRLGLRDPATLYFLTRRLQGRNRHPWSVTPLRVMTASESLTPVAVSEPVPLPTASPQARRPGWEETAKSFEAPLAHAVAGLSWSRETDP